MEPISITFIISAFVAGLLMFLAPCTFPIVPAYLGFISGVSFEKARGEATKKAARRTVLLNGFFFVLGFSAVFILFGALAGFLGELFSPLRLWLTRIGGILVIFFGLFLLGVFRLKFLSAEHRVTLSKRLPVGNPGTSFLLGGAFALGWTPCVGPILGSILLLASTSATALEGAFLLSIFSLGLSVPFLLVAFLFAHATTSLKRVSRHLVWISRVGGIFLILLGLLLLSDNFDLTIEYGYRFLDFLHCERLLEYL